MSHRKSCCKDTSLTHQKRKSKQNKTKTQKSVYTLVTTSNICLLKFMNVLEEIAGIKHT